MLAYFDQNTISPRQTKIYPKTEHLVQQATIAIFTELQKY